MRSPDDGGDLEVLTEWQSKEGLGTGLPRPREALTHSAGEAAMFTAGDSTGSFVAKASGVAHKSEENLVRLGLDADGVAAVWDELARRGDGTVLVAEQVRGSDLELIVGAVRDPQFGPVVSVGVGGVSAEVFGDAVFVLSPPEAGELDAALAELRAAPLLAGFRGRRGVDRDALRAIVDAVADLMERDPTVMEVDCNPVLVCDSRPVVVDALVVRQLGEDAR